MKIHLDDSEIYLTRWATNGLQLVHSISTYDDFGVRSSQNNSEAIRLHFGLKGAYHFKYKQLNAYFELMTSHHNIMYSKGLDITVYNKSKEIETFGIDFPVMTFLKITSDGSEVLKRFAAKVMQEKTKIYMFGCAAISDWKVGSSLL